MYKKFFLLFSLFVFIFSSCSKSRTNNNSTEPVAEIFTENEKILELNSLLEKGFSHSYSQKIDTQINQKIDDLTSLSDKEKDFYDKFVGVYARKEMNSKILRMRYSFSVVDNSDGTYSYNFPDFDYFKIDYNFENQCFYTGDVGAAERIDIETFQLPENLEKISLGNISPIDCTSSSNDEIEGRLQTLLTSFYKKLAVKDFENIIDNILYADEFKDINSYSLEVKKFSRKELIHDLGYLYFCFEDHNDPEAFYINVYFSEDKDFVSSIYGDIQLVELKYSDRYNYFSFFIKEVDEDLKIVGYRNDLNMM